MTHLLFALLCAAALLSAQEFRSTLSGRVTDPSGAVIVGVKIQSIETESNTRYATVTNSDGLYTFPLLLPGTYALTAEVKGLKKFSQTGIEAGANTRVAQDITLTVGDMTETVSITSDAAPIANAPGVGRTGDHYQ